MRILEPVLMRPVPMHATRDRHIEPEQQDALGAELHSQIHGLIAAVAAGDDKPRLGRKTVFLRCLMHPMNAGILKGDF